MCVCGGGGGVPRDFSCVPTAGRCSPQVAPDCVGPNGGTGGITVIHIIDLCVGAAMSMQRPSDGPLSSAGTGDLLVEFT